MCMGLAMIADSGFSFISSTEISNSDWVLGPDGTLAGYMDNGVYNSFYAAGAPGTSLAIGGVFFPKKKKVIATLADAPPPEVVVVPPPPIVIIDPPVTTLGVYYGVAESINNYQTGSCSGEFNYASGLPITYSTY